MSGNLKIKYDPGYGLFYDMELDPEDAWKKLSTISRIHKVDYDRLRRYLDKINYKFIMVDEVRHVVFNDPVLLHVIHEIHSNRHNPRIAAKKVGIIDRDTGRVLRPFNSVQAAVDAGYNESHLRGVITGKRGNKTGTVWRYLDENYIPIPAKHEEYRYDWEREAVKGNNIANNHRDGLSSHDQKKQGQP